MFRTWILTGILMAVVVAAAQTQVRPATVEGIVKNSRTGEPIADVRVTLSPEFVATSAKTATSDADGRFVINAVPPGRYNVSAARTLFFRPRLNTGASAVTVSDGERFSGLQIFLAPTGVISGRILDERREPQRSVRVEALRREYRDGLAAWVANGQATTDDRGEYRLFNLTPGTYYVRATQQSVAPLYYPGLPDADSAIAVNIEVGSEASAIDIEMRKTPEHVVRLRLGGIPPGAGTTSFVVRRKTTRSNDTLPVRPESLADNVYKLSLPPGSYDVVVQVSSTSTVGTRVLSNAGIFPVVVGNRDQDLGTLAVPQTIPVNGRIVATEPVTGLTPERLNVTLTSSELSMSTSTRGGTPAIETNGNFRLSNVAPGRYRIQLTGLPPDAYLVSAREGPREVLDSGVTVRGDSEPLELRIAGPGSIGGLDGTIVNALGQPVPAATIVLVPAPERRSNASAFRTSTSDQNGNFSIRAILPGEYRVLAWEDIESGAYFDPDFLRNFETRGEAIRLQRGSQTRVTVRVIPAP
jgi:hypothetical protein